MMNRQKGFTLIELMITVAVLAIVLSIAAPSFSNILLNNRINTTAHELQAAMQIARSEAVMRKSTVTLCRANAALDSCADGTDWSQGWLLIFGDEVLKVWQVGGGLEVVGPTAGIAFFGSGMVRQANSVSVQGQGCPNGEQRKVHINRAGGVRMEKNSC